MKAKDYLLEIRPMRRELQLCRNMVGNAHITYESIRGMDYAADRVQTSPRNSLEEAAWRMLERQKEAERESISLTEEINRRLLQIRSMSKPVYTDILYLHYYEGKKLSSISNILGYTVGSIRNLHWKALAEFEKRYLNGEAHEETSSRMV